MPPLPAVFPRIAKEDVEVNGILIPRGTHVMVDIHTMHHSPAIWSSPTSQFDPDRFAQEGEAQQADGYGWLPFGAGGRRCPGMNFSLSEQRAFIATLLRKYEWELPANSIHRDGIKLEENNATAPYTMEVVFKKRHQ